jgi:hypothetical protein
MTAKTSKNNQKIINFWTPLQRLAKDAVVLRQPSGTE